MSRHELDLMSLVAGLFFSLLGLGFLLHAGTDVELDPEWVWPIALIAVGAAGLIGSFVSARGDTRENGGGPSVEADLEPEPAEDR